MAEHPLHQDAWLIYGRTQLALGQYDQAVFTFTDMINRYKFEDRIDIYYYRGLARLWLEQGKEAKADFTKSWRQLPEEAREAEQAKAKLMLVWLAWSEKKPTRRTASRWEEGIDYSPFDWHVSLLSLLSSLVMSENEGDLVRFDSLIADKPTRFEAYFWKGMACASFEKYEEAISLWQQALLHQMPPILLGPLRWFERDHPSIWPQVKAMLEPFHIFSQKEAGT